MLDIILLVLMVLAAVWSVMAKTLLKSAIALAIVSIIISIFMFQFNCSLAAVFELSVCTGLITVIFLSAIALTKPLTLKESRDESMSILKRYMLLPVILVITGFACFRFLHLPMDFRLIEMAAVTEVRHVLWSLRHLDLIGQIVILLVGGFGAVLLFKEIERHDW